MSNPVEETKTNAETVVKDSLQTHGKASYYHADYKLPKETQELIKNQELIGGGSDPKFLGASEKQKISRTIEINKYDFMNDGFWIKAIIDLNKNYNELINITEENLKIEFTNNSFKLTISLANSLDSYVLWMPRTRENFLPEKSKCYLRKGKVYVALYKEKEEEWWTLKGV